MSGFDITMYREMFVEEAEELFESADNILLEAEKNGSLTDDEMGQLFRDVHTLKGSGASVELSYFAEFTHDVENLMDNLRNHKIIFIIQMAETLIDGLDVMKEILQLECDGKMDRPTFDSMSTELLVMIRGYLNTDISMINKTKENSKEVIEQVIQEDEIVQENDFHNSSYGYFDGSLNKVTIKKDSLSENRNYGFYGEHELSNELISSNDFGFFGNEDKIMPNHELDVIIPKTTTIEKTPLIEKETVKKVVLPTKKDSSSDKLTKKPVANNIRVNLDKIDNLMNNVGDLVITNAMLTQFSTTIKDKKTRASVLERLELLERFIREMQDSIMSIRMVPMESIYSKFPKVIRDISRKLNKKIDFKHEGDSVEIDKAMIEGLTDPLMHIIRNSLDHGLETPQERKDIGKNETGTILISAEQANGQMIITISDDGKGVAFEKVAFKALENGLIDENQYNTMTDNEKAMLIFGAGLSTASEVTEISGRGVGMDVVKTNIQKLGGIIKLDTEINKGTIITIMLPLTLAILDGLDIAVGDMRYILPLSSIVESLQPTSDMIKKIGDGTQDLLMLREEFIPVVRLYQLFDVKPKHTILEDGMLIVVKSGTTKIAMFIDEFLHQHQVVVKPLDKNFRAVSGIGAATVRGDGSIGLILDIVGLIEVQKNFEHKGKEFNNTEQKVS